MKTLSTITWLLLACLLVAPLVRPARDIEDHSLAVSLLTTQVPWWRRWLPSWGGDMEPPVTVYVTPTNRDGLRGTTMELSLPPSQIPKQHLQPDNAIALPDYYTYNSSEMIPIVPAWLAWMTDAARMANRSRGLDESVAHSVAEHVAAAYCDYQNLAPWNCSRCDQTFIPAAVIHDPDWDLQGYVGFSTKLNAIIVAFRGTDSHSIYNWAENMRTWRTDFSLHYPGAPSGTLVHGGFFYSYNSSYLAGNITSAVRQIVLQRAAHPRGTGHGAGESWGSGDLEHLIQDDGNGPIDADILLSAPTVIVAGHSLGAAMATLCAMDLRLNLQLPDVRLMTFGSPRVGNHIFANWVDQEIESIWRFTHNRDIVPSLPPSYMGFYHIPREVWIVDFLFERTLVGVCDKSGEDPLCHNSVCHLGLCSSLTDHMMYLTGMYQPHPQGC